MYRLGFADEGSKLRLRGLEARAMLRWLRLKLVPGDPGGDPRNHRTVGATTETVDRNPVVRLRLTAETVANPS